MKQALPVFLAALLLTLAAPAAAQFPPVSEAERALTSVAEEPNAPAVILFKRSEFLMMGYGNQGEISSRLLVQERRKILTEQGKELAEVGVAHSDAVRLSGFKGRTILPDGRILPLGDDARFQRKASKRDKRRETSVVFPGVEVGAILDYQYELRFDSFFYLEPWYLADELPVVRAEIVFKVPHEVRAQAWRRDPFKEGIQVESHQNSSGTEIRVWADHLASVPADPFGLPFSDLAAKMMMVPLAYDNGAYETKLLESWASVCKIVDELYDKAQRNDGVAAKKGREIADAAGAAGSGARQRAEALYRFVRDEIETVPLPGIFLNEGSAVDRTLKQRSGDYVEKAMLLHAMMRAAKLDARMVWAANRWRGQVEPEIANPDVFDMVLVAVNLEGKRHYLDPSDRALAFGRLQFAYEGTSALVFDAKKPEMVVLPETPFDQSGRRAVINLAVDGEGRIAGKGEIAFTGHHAWQKIDWQEDDTATAEAWKKWLTQEYEGFQIDEIRFEEKPDEQAARVTWTLRQREEEVLGDETSLFPSGPVGPFLQPFVQDASKRRSPVLFAFPDRDEVELRLSWPEGWKIDSQPRLVSSRNRAGELSVNVELNEAERSLVYRRRMDITQRQLGTLELYEEARALFGAAEKSDAEALLLVRK